MVDFNRETISAEKTETSKPGLADQVRCMANANANTYGQSSEQSVDLNHRCQTLAGGPRLTYGVKKYMAHEVTYSARTTDTTIPRMLCWYSGTSIRTGL